MNIRLESPADAPAVADLYLEAFGPGQFAKAASLLREGNVALKAACVVAEDGGELIGACRIWPLRSEAGDCVLLGPIAVRAARRKDGIGALLAQAALDACDGLGIGCIVLVGDLPFFGRFGFEAVPAGRLNLPAPVDPKRLLWRCLDGVDLPAGRLRV